MFTFSSKQKTAKIKTQSTYTPVNSKTNVFSETSQMTMRNLSAYEGSAALRRF